MTDLTKQWKEKTLESCQDYYVKYKNGVIGRAKLLETPDFYGFYNNCPLDDMVEEVLAKVPSYEEWQELCNRLAKVEDRPLFAENQLIKMHLFDKQHECENLKMILRETQIYVSLLVDAKSVTDYTKESANKLLNKIDEALK